MGIRARILIACLAMASVTVLFGVYARTAQHDLAVLATRIYDEAFTAVSYLRSAQNGLNNLEADWRRSAANFGRSAGGEFSGPLHDVQEDLDVASERSMSPAGRGAVDRVDAELRNLAHALISGASHDRTATLFERAGQEFATAVEVYAADGYRYRQRAGEMVKQSEQRTWGAIAAALAAALVITLGLTRAILPPVRRAVQVAQAVAAGKLDNHIEASGRCEMADLLRALRTMQDKIAAKQARIEALIAEQASSHAGELAAQHARLEAALSNMVQGLCLFDADQRLVVYNSRFSEMFGVPPEGASPEEALADPAWAVLQGNGSVRTAAFSCDLPDGRSITVSKRPVAGGGWVATYEDTTERRHAEARVAHMARHDALTGLANRVLFRERMQHALARAKRSGGVALLCLDLDHFKSVNDTLGHPVGDALLCEVAARLRHCTRETDLVVRLGGDEFAIVQEGPTQLADVEALARRLVDSLAEPFEINEHQFVVGTSIGIAISDGETDDTDILLKSADLALYRAKSDGRGTWRFFEVEMDAVAQTRRALELDLRQALAGGQFRLFYQPLMKASGAGINGFEALIRWCHPKRGMVNPALFIPLAEEVGLISSIGSWVLRQACADAVRWPGQLKVAVNLSPAQFRNGMLAREVEDALLDSGLDPERLELEITENVLLQDHEAVLQTLHAIRAKGVRIAMDDFGTGYSSLSYLRRFPFDKIKIDQSFVRGLDNDDEAIAIVRAIAGLGRTLGMTVNAEGVETAEQLAALQALDCSEVQGYLFSTPKPASEVAGLLRQYGNASVICHPSLTSAA